MRPSTSDFLSPEAAAEYIRTAAHLGATEGETAVAGATPLAAGTRKTAGLATRDAWAAVRINAVRNIFLGCVVCMYVRDAQEMNFKWIEDGQLKREAQVVEVESWWLWWWRW